MQKHTVVAIIQASLIVLILLWFIAVMVDCESFLARECDAAIWASWLDLWRLGWVKNYKELIAGILAAGAGVFAYLAALATIRADRDVRAEMQRKAAKATAACLRRAVINVAEKANAKIPASQEDRNRLTAACEGIATIDATLYSLIAMNMHRLEHAISGLAVLDQQDGHRDEKRQLRVHVRREALLITTYLAADNTIFDNFGRFTFARLSNRKIEEQFVREGLGKPDFSDPLTLMLA